MGNQAKMLGQDKADYGPRRHPRTQTQTFETMGNHALYHDGCCRQPAGHAMKFEHYSVFLSLPSMIPVDVLARKYKRLKL